MEFEELYKELKKFEKDKTLEEVEIFDDYIGLYWTEFVDVLINDNIFLISSIVLKSEGLEIYGSMGAKLFEFDEITEFDIDV